MDRMVVFPVILSLILLVGDITGMAGVHDGYSTCDTCDPLPAPTNRVVDVDTTAGLVQALNAANEEGGNRTIRMASGTYQLSRMLVITAPDITVRGANGNRRDVVVQGNGTSGGVGHVFLVRADRFTVADLSLGLVRYHAVQVQGEQDADAVLVHNVRFFDIGEQMLKVSYNDDTPANRSDHGVVRCCLFEYTSGVGPRYYIGGIDGHACDDWQVYDNEFRHIRSPESRLAEHAVHFWSGSANSVVERNVIVNCDRGIGFGMGDSSHQGGVIRNNMVHTSRDVGIGLESAPDVWVLNNTVYTENYDNAIEYRFTATRNVVIRGNLTHGIIKPRQGGSGTVTDNFTGATADFFVDHGVGDLHLATAHPDVVDQAPVLAQVVEDMDCGVRPAGSAPDFGAHEWGASGKRVPAAPTNLSVDDLNNF